MTEETTPPLPSKQEKDRASQRGFWSWVLFLFAGMLLFVAFNVPRSGGWIDLSGCLPALLSFISFCAGTIVSIQGLRIYSHSWPCWVGLCLNLGPPMVFILQNLFLRH